MAYLRYTLEKGVVLWIIDNCTAEEIESLMAGTARDRR